MSVFDRHAQHHSIGDIYHSHHQWLRSWLTGRLNCSDMAADLVQDTFVKIMQKQRAEAGFRIDYPRRYLRMVANGLMVDYFRRRSVEQAYLNVLAQKPEPVTISSEEREIILQTLQQLDTLLDAMPSAVRRAFIMSRLDGLTYQQIAEQLDVSLRTVKRYMQQAFIQCLDLML